MKKPYCTQNNGDCYNVPIRGGKRNGAGRPATGRKKKNVYVTDSEFAEIKKLIEQIRASE